MDEQVYGDGLENYLLNNVNADNLDVTSGTNNSTLLNIIDKEISGRGSNLNSSAREVGQNESELSVKLESRDSIRSETLTSNVDKEAAVNSVLGQGYKASSASTSNVSSFIKFSKAMQQNSATPLGLPYSLNAPISESPYQTSPTQNTPTHFVKRRKQTTKADFHNPTISAHMKPLQLRGRTFMTPIDYQQVFNKIVQQSSARVSPTTHVPAKNRPTTQNLVKFVNKTPVPAAQPKATYLRQTSSPTAPSTSTANQTHILFQGPFIPLSQLEAAHHTPTPGKSIKQEPLDELNDVVVRAQHQDLFEMKDEKPDLKVFAQQTQQQPPIHNNMTHTTTKVAQTSPLLHPLPRSLLSGKQKQKQSSSMPLHFLDSVSYPMSTNKKLASVQLIPPVYGNRVVRRRFRVRQDKLAKIILHSEDGKLLSDVIQDEDGRILARRWRLCTYGTAEQNKRTQEDMGVTKAQNSNYSNCALQEARCLEAPDNDSLLNSVEVDIDKAALVGEVDAEKPHSAEGSVELRDAAVDQWLLVEKAVNILDTQNDYSNVEKQAMLEVIIKVLCDKNMGIPMEAEYRGINETKHCKAIDQIVRHIRSGLQGKMTILQLMCLPTSMQPVPAIYVPFNPLPIAHEHLLQVLTKHVRIVNADEPTTSRNIRMVNCTYEIITQKNEFVWATRKYALRGNINMVHVFNELMAKESMRTMLVDCLDALDPTLNCNFSEEQIKRIENVKILTCPTSSIINKVQVPFIHALHALIMLRKGEPPYGYDTSLFRVKTHRGNKEYFEKLFKELIYYFRVLSSERLVYAKACVERFIEQKTVASIASSMQFDEEKLERMFMLVGKFIVDIKKVDTMDAVFSVRLYELAHEWAMELALPSFYRSPLATLLLENATDKVNITFDSTHVIPVKMQYLKSVEFNAILPQQQGVAATSSAPQIPPIAISKIEVNKEPIKKQQQQPPLFYSNSIKVKQEKLDPRQPSTSVSTSQISKSTTSFINTATAKVLANPQTGGGVVKRYRVAGSNVMKRPVPDVHTRIEVTPIQQANQDDPLFKKKPKIEPPGDG